MRFYTNPRGLFEGGEEMMDSESRLRKIIEASELILSVCDGAFSRDEEGYDIFDAKHFRDFLVYPDIFGVEGLTPEEVEWMRRKLLRYKRQLQEMGFDTSVLDQPVHSVAFYTYAQDWEGNWCRLSPHSLKKVGKWIIDILKHVEKHDNWVRMKLVFKRGTNPLKKVWIRFNDPDKNGKTQKWWE
jgi:hypothetical protein